MLAAVYQIINSAPQYIIPLLIKLIIDSYIPMGDEVRVITTIFIVIIMGLVHILYHVAFGVQVTRVLANVSRDLRNRLVHKMQILSLKMLNKSESGRFYSKIMRDVEHVENFGRQMYGSWLNVGITLIISTVILAAVNIKLLGLLMIIAPIFILVNRLFRKRLRQDQHQVRKANENLSQAVNNLIQTYTLVRVHGEEEYSRELIDEKNRYLVDRNQGLHLNISFFAASTTVMGQLMQVLIVVLAAIAVIRKQLLLGEMFLFIQYFNMIVNKIIAIINQFPILLRFSESMNSINEVLDSPDIEYNAGKKQVRHLKGHIGFERVSFNYDQHTRVLKNINLSIEPGETVGLVGPSGSGKTTFVNLVLGLYRGYDGIITIDDMPLDTIDMRSVRQQIGVVTQEPILFSGTVRDNIVHGRHVDGDAPVIEAARKANAHEFITDLADGYDSLIGERGVTLSGGQKQRVALARAILRQPAILVLDEATSALDSEAEREVQGAIDKMLGNQTTFVIAHRLSTIFNADRILVFKKGRIAEQGSHQKLLHLDGEYVKLLSIQFNMPVEKLRQMK